MAKKNFYVCNNCGSVQQKWYGKCPDCGEWNTLEEREHEQTVEKKHKSFSTAKTISATPLNKIEISTRMRFSTGLEEFDRVLGGGIVEGSVTLLAGEPGIGKSTLLLQICNEIAKFGTILYVSGEESSNQIKLRAKRLGVEAEELYILSETNMNKIIPEINALRPKIVIIDSIQTMYDDDVASSPGSVTQVKQSAMMLMQEAKTENISILIVGHVNKDGAIAGPKVLEHIVDAVLCFDGDKQHAYRIIHAAKNRFGSTNEIGVFEMGSVGLIQVENPSALLLSQRPRGVSGSCAVCVMEGSRPILAEVQTLSSPTVYPSPKRTSQGVDYNRLALILAVLEKRLGYRFSANDVYVNVAGGLRIDEPAADLSLALSLISSYKNVSVSEDTVAFGEIGLAGECRSVPNIEQRISEASRMGFTKIVLPKRCSVKSIPEGVELIKVLSVFDLLGFLGI